MFYYHFLPPGVGVRVSKMTIHPGVRDDENDEDSEEDFQQDDPIGNCIEQY